MKTTIKILLIHGVGHAEADAAWAEGWEEAITQAIRQQGTAANPLFSTVSYDSLFERSKIDLKTVVAAMRRLLAGGLARGDDLRKRRRGINDAVRWTAGMVAQWASDEKLRSGACELIRQAIKEHNPAVICAHSLGSLIAYDLFARDKTVVRGRTFVSFGSQIGNRFVRSIFGGRITPLPAADRWVHLYNREDSVLTAPIRLTADNFEQVETPFDIPGPLDHAPRKYLSHANAAEHLWNPLCHAETKLAGRSRKLWRSSRKKPEQQALLVGINDYPNPADRLEGCVNDVFRMSEVLQEGGLKPENIRVLLNNRATARGIRERLEWLLDGAGPDGTRIFYYSGHGAQIPNYGEDDEIDHEDECLVPYDFDWTPERALIDDWFCELYSQLPYETEFIVILDCCYSGGMAKNGALRMRGLSPPDDIRHRSMMWNSRQQMWGPRKMKMGERELLEKDEERKENYTGTSGAVKRLGRSVSLWSSSAAKFEKGKKDFGHYGPYMPTLLQACREDQYSFEYRHGSASYGAFTYSLTETLRRRSGKDRVSVSFERLMEEVADKIKALRYDQTPMLLCPKSKQGNVVPF